MLILAVWAPQRPSVEFNVRGHRFQQQMRTWTRLRLHSGRISGEDSYNRPVRAHILYAAFNLPEPVLQSLLISMAQLMSSTRRRAFRTMLEGDDGWFFVECAALIFAALGSGGRNDVLLV